MGGDRDFFAVEFFGIPWSGASQRVYDAPQEQVRRDDAACCRTPLRCHCISDPKRPKHESLFPAAFRHVLAFPRNDPGLVLFQRPQDKIRTLRRHLTESADCVILNIDDVLH